VASPGDGPLIRLENPTQLRVRTVPLETSVAGQPAAGFGKQENQHG
jgi:hypothetical protein